MRSLGNSLSLTPMDGELWTCFLASMSSFVKKEVQRRIFFLAVARICLKSAVQSRQILGSLYQRYLTLKGKPNFLSLLFPYEEREVRNSSVALVGSILFRSFEHDLKRRGQEVSFDGGQSFTKNIDKRIKLFLSSQDTSILLDLGSFIECGESLIIEHDL